MTDSTIGTVSTEDPRILDALEDTRARNATRAGIWGFAGFLLAIGSLPLIFRYTSLNVSPNQNLILSALIFIGVLVIGAFAAAIVCSRRSSHAASEGAELLVSGLEPPRDVPMTAGERIGPYIVLASTPDLLQIARMRGVWPTRIRQSVIFFFGVAMIFTFVSATRHWGWSLARAGLTAGDWKNYVVYWASPVIGVCCIIYTLLPIPLQVIVDKQQRTVLIERIHWIYLHSLAEVAFADVQSVVEADDSVSIKTTGAKIHKLASWSNPSHDEYDARGDARYLYHVVTNARAARFAKAVRAVLDK